MRENELAADYLAQYEDTDVTIIDVSRCYSGPECLYCAFDLSDGTHWLSDNSSIGQAAYSLVDCELEWDDAEAWVIVNDDGSRTSIEWID